MSITNVSSELIHDFETILDGISKMPLAYCDSNGILIHANAAAWKLLGSELGLNPRMSIALNLGIRTTANHILMEPPTADSVGFYMADVQILLLPDTNRDGTPDLDSHSLVGAVDVVITPLPSGGLWVELSAQSPSKIEAGSAPPPARRILRQLAAFQHSAGVLHTPEEVVGLLATTLQTALGDVGLVIEIRDGAAPTADTPTPPFEGQFTHGYKGAGTEHGARRPLSWVNDYDIPPSAFCLQGSVSGARFRLETTGSCIGVMQVESLHNDHFDPEVREALSLFAHLLATEIVRLLREVVPTTVLDAIDALVCVCDLRRRIRGANRAFCKQIEASEVTIAAIAGRDILDFIHDDDQEAFRKAASITMGTRGRQALSIRIGPEADTFLTHLSATDTPGGVSGLSVIFHTVEGGAHALEDLQQLYLRETLEARLQEAERMISLGQLAAGIAHEIKNPLTSIMSYSDYLLGKYRGRLFEARDSERLERIIAGVERIDRFVKDLLHYARPDAGEHRALSLNLMISEAIELCEIPLGAVSLDTRLEADPDMILGVPGQVQQIYVNLLSNAAGALADTERRGEIIIRSYLEEDRVVTEVQDNGCGIPQDQLEQIFEPFYTSRAHETGSGLGLSIVRSLIERHNGDISLESEVGVGTCFKVSFPSSS